jgi:hypothetical protein
VSVPFFMACSNTSLSLLTSPYTPMPYYQRRCLATHHDKTISFAMRLFFSAFSMPVSRSLPRRYEEEIVQLAPKKFTLIVSQGPSGYFDDDHIVLDVVEGSQKLRAHLLDGCPVIEVTRDKIADWSVVPNALCDSCAMNLSTTVSILLISVQLFDNTTVCQKYQSNASC